jgi:hypothetical protein
MHGAGRVENGIVSSGYLKRIREVRKNVKEKSKTTDIGQPVAIYSVNLWQSCASRLQAFVLSCFVGPENRRSAITGWNLVFYNMFSHCETKSKNHGYSVRLPFVRK